MNIHPDIEIYNFLFMTRVNDEALVVLGKWNLINDYNNPGLLGTKDKHFSKTVRLLLS